jgi:outer membrane protein assembly factor BamB
VGSYDARVYCLDLASGKELWKFETAGRVHGTAALAEGHALVAGCDEFLHVLRLADGQSVRQVSMGSVSGVSAAVAGERVFLGTYGNEVRCIDWKTGAALWSFRAEERQFPFMSSAAVTPQAVIVGGRDKRLRAFDPATGRVLWTFESGGRIDSSPVVAGERVYVGAGDGNLYAVDLGSGREQARFELGGSISASPAVAQGCLVIGSEDGVLYCLAQGPTQAPGPSE